MSASTTGPETVSPPSPRLSNSLTRTSSNQIHHGSAQILPNQKSRTLEAFKLMCSVLSLISAFILIVLSIWSNDLYAKHPVVFISIGSVYFAAVLIMFSCAYITGWKQRSNVGKKRRICLQFATITILGFFGDQFQEGQRDLYLVFALLAFAAHLELATWNFQTRERYGLIEGVIGLAYAVSVTLVKPGVFKIPVIAVGALVLLLFINRKELPKYCMRHSKSGNQPDSSSPPGNGDGSTTTSHRIMSSSSRNGSGSTRNRIMRSSSRNGGGSMGHRIMSSLELNTAELGLLTRLEDTEALPKAEIEGEDTILAKIKANAKVTRAEASSSASNETRPEDQTKAEDELMIRLKSDIAEAMYKAKGKAVNVTGAAEAFSSASNKTRAKDETDVKITANEESTSENQVIPESLSKSKSKNERDLRLRKEQAKGENEQVKDGKEVTKGQKATLKQELEDGVYEE